ncbi:MAG: lipopolysaccharide assembly protein LapA domain-containing protein [Gaiellales bacterium]
MDAAPAKTGDRRPYVLLAILAVVLIYLLAFALLNTRVVEVSFVAFSTETSLIWLMLASVAIGLILGVVGTLWIGRRRRHRA